MDTDKTIHKCLEEFDDLEIHHQELGRSLLIGKLCIVDLFTAGVLNRSLSISSAFKTLLEAHNFIAAAPLIRLQLDSALRFYAVFIVNKPKEFCMEVLRGTPIRELKDKTGKKLSDKHLIKSLTEDERLSIDRSWVKSVYKQTSGYIHLSEKHFHNCIRASSGGDIDIAISDFDAFISDDIRLEAIDAFMEITKLVLELVGYWAAFKHQMDSEQL